MISNLIVLLSLVFAGAYALAWLLRRDLRERIERPKHRFQDRLSQYDRQCHDAAEDEDISHA